MPTKLGFNTEAHTFRQVAITSYLIATIALICGMTLMLSMKGDLADGNNFQAFSKLFFGVIFIGYGGRSFWRGFRSEFPFDTTKAYAPKHNNNVAHLLSGGELNDTGARKRIVDIMKSRAYVNSSLKHSLSDWQFLFFKLLSKDRGSNLMENMPQPIAVFAARQTAPMYAVAVVIMLLLVYLFINYLGLISIPFHWFGFVATLGLVLAVNTKPIENFTLHKSNENWFRQTGTYFIILSMAYMLFTQTSQVKDAGIALAILMAAILALITYSSISGFRIFDRAFSERRTVDVQVTGGVHESRRAATQPDAIRQQFDNVMQRNTGWAFAGEVLETGQKLAGDNMRKGDYKLEMLYETQPQLVSTTYTSDVEQRLMNLWRIGTVLVSLGLIAITLAVFQTSSVDVAGSLAQFQYNATSSFPYALLLMIVGIVFLALGRKLVYETYLFCNSEMVFESSLILFGISCNFDEYKVMTGNMLRKDTFTDYTLHLMTSKVTSSCFVSPYQQDEDLRKQPRYLLQMDADVELYKLLLTDLDKQLAPYNIAIGAHHTTGTDLPPANSDANLLLTEPDEIE